MSGSNLSGNARSPGIKSADALPTGPISTTRWIDAVQVILFEHLQKPLSSSVYVSLGPSGVAVMTGLTNEPETLQGLIDLARRIETAVQ
jgi:hypothetical protein